MFTTLPDFRRLLGRPRVLLAMLLIGAALFFLPNLADPFVSDDWHHLWIAGHRTQPLWAYFTTNYEGTTSGGSYRPLVNVLWAAVDAAGGGLSLFGRLFGHTVALVAHLLCVALVFLIGRMLVHGRRGTALGALAALLFALMPNHPEAVNWVGAASDPIATAALLAGVLLYLDGHAALRLRWFHLVGPAAAMAVGLVAKETAIVLPAVIGLHALFNLHRPWRASLARVAALLAPLALVAVAYLLVRYRATGLLYGYYGAERISVDLMVATRTFLAIPVSQFLSGPARTHVMDALYRGIDTHAEAYLLAALVPGLLLLFRARRRVWWLTASAIIAVVPVMQFGLNHLPGRWSDEGERYAYMPSAFGALLAAWAALALWKRVQRSRPALVVVGLVLFVALAVQLGQKNISWFESSRFAEEVVRSWPEQIADQVFVYGLPDNLRGVPLWRNGFAQRLEAEGEQPSDLRVSDIRTVMDEPHGFWANDGGDHFLYYSDPPEAGARDIVGPTPADRTPTSYGVLPWETEFSIYALTYRHFAADAIADPRPTTSDASAAFWMGDGWTMRPLSLREVEAVQ
ncbi:MAG: hypothetical protein AAB974_01305 [Patescibacteria group bacterium]